MSNLPSIETLNSFVKIAYVCAGLQVLANYLQAAI